MAFHKDVISQRSPESSRHRRSAKQAALRYIVFGHEEEADFKLALAISKYAPGPTPQLAYPAQVCEAPSDIGQVQSVPVGEVCSADEPDPYAVIVLAPEVEPVAEAAESCRRQTLASPTVRIADPDTRWSVTNPLVGSSADERWENSKKRG
jgi:hypothetical protein